MMRLFPCLVLLLLAGCASRPSQRGPFGDQTEAQEDHDFFYGHWWKPTHTGEEAEDHQFFYGSRPR